MADLSEVRTWEGILYAAVIDYFSRRCVGWAIAEHMRAELVVEALEMAGWQHKPPAGIVHHPDQRPQYTALFFGQRCREAGIDASMGSKGSALDNAVCESFFASLKKGACHGGCNGECSWCCARHRLRVPRRKLPRARAS